jgi:fructokinase
VVAGSPLHIAAHLHEFGWRSILITRLGKDAAGRSILDTILKLGLDPSYVESDPELPSGRVTIKFDDDDHSFEIHGPSAWDRLEGPIALPRHDAFCFGTLAGRSSQSFATLQRLLHSACEFKVMDVNLRPPDVVDEVLWRGLEAARLVKVNETEFLEVATALGFPGTAAAYFERGPNLRWLCVTRGEAGAELHRRDGESWAVEGAHVEVVDTVGAGDAFTAALIDGLGRGRPEQETLERAQRLATAMVTRRGGLSQSSTTG